MAIDSSDNVYASFIQNSSVEKFSSTGVDLGLYTPTPNVGSEGLAFDAAGNLLVAGGSSVYSIPPGGGAATAYGTGFGNALYIAVIPEPASLGMLCLAAVALIGGRRRD